MPIAARSAAVGWNVVSSQACDLAHERETSDLAHREARPQPGGTASDRHRCADDTRSEALGHDEVGVRRRVDTTFDVALAADDGRLEEARDGAGGLHGLGRCRRRGARPTEHRAPPAVQLDGHDPQRCRRRVAETPSVTGVAEAGLQDHRRAARAAALQEQLPPIDRDRAATTDVHLIGDRAVRRELGAVGGRSGRRHLGGRRRRGAIVRARCHGSGDRRARARRSPIGGRWP